MLQVKKLTIGMYLLPTFLLIALINLYPIFYTFNLSFTNKTTFNRLNYHYVGGKNYQYIIDHARDNFLPVLGNTLLYVLICVALFVIFGLATAMALNNPKIRGLRWWRLALILPWTVPSFITALIWKFLFNYDFGPINQIMRAVSQNPHAGVAWLDQPIPAFIAVVIVNVWLSYPFFMIVTLGALQSIPAELNEAAEVDGASAWQRFRLITLPLLRPALTPAVVLSSITTFQMFNTVYLITLGGPFGANIDKPGATEFVMVYMYNLFQNGGAFFINYARIATVAVLIFVLLFLMVLIGLRTSNFYEEAKR